MMGVVDMSLPHIKAFIVSSFLARDGFQNMRSYNLSALMHEQRGDSKGDKGF